MADKVALLIRLQYMCRWANLDPATDGQACVGHVPSTSNEQVGRHKHSSERRQHHSIEEEEEGGVSADKEKEEGGTVASGKYEDEVVGYLWNFLQGSHSTDSGFMCKGFGESAGNKAARESNYLGWFTDFLSYACENRLQT